MKLYSGSAIGHNIDATKNNITNNSTNEKNAPYAYAFVIGVA
jgi:hypothetical protein